MSEKGKNFLCKDSVDSNPLEQLKNWLEDAVMQEVQEPYAMVLATISSQLRPNSRTVLLKEMTQEGLTFFTNYRSRKGLDLEEHPFAAVTFFWKELARQVCVEGIVTRLEGSQSEQYFKKRPRGSQVAAWASKQSKVVESREELERCYARAESSFFGKEIPLPEYWGGYLLVPQRIEFWQEREWRLHDRLEYSWEDAEWKVRRLFP